MRDVVIIGGGPGGLESARLLAADGWDVAVFEEHASSGDPVHCTGVIAIEAFDELGLSRDVILNPLRTARFIAPSGLSVEHTTPAVEAVVVDRLALDRWLHAEATRAGAAVVVGRRATAVDVDRAGLTVAFSDGSTARGRACVLACGAQYAIQRRLGMGLPAAYLQSAQLELPAARPRDVEVRFGRRLAPGGFAWAVPVHRQHGPHARVGLMCDSDSARHFHLLVRDIAPRWGIDPAPADRPLVPRQKVLPLAPIARTFSDRVVAVGDAAGLVKPTTGGGIYYGLLSGGMAARVLDGALRDDDLGESRLREYEKMWNARLGPEIRAGLAFRNLVSRLNDRAIEALVELASVDGLVPVLKKSADFNWHRGAVLALLKHAGFRRILFNTIWS